MKRLTTDNPQSNFECMMNYAYDKDGRVTLRYGAGKQDIDLCEYMAIVAKSQCESFTADDFMEGACLECDCCECPYGILYTVAVQAAELRVRLKEYEDREYKNKRRI